MSRTRYGRKRLSRCTAILQWPILGVQHRRCLPRSLPPWRKTRLRATRYNADIRLAVVDSILVAGKGRARGRVLSESQRRSISRRFDLIGMQGRFKALASHQRPALVSSLLRSPFSLFFFLLRSASRPGREEKMRGSRSFIPRGGVQRELSRCAISGSSARERAGTHARASLIESLTCVCVRVRVRREIDALGFRN